MSRTDGMKYQQYTLDVDHLIRGFDIRLVFQDWQFGELWAAMQKPRSCMKQALGNCYSQVLACKFEKCAYDDSDRPK